MPTWHCRKRDGASLCQLWCLAQHTLMQSTSPNQRNSSGLLFLPVYQAESSNSSVRGLLEGSRAPRCLLVTASHRHDLPFAGAVPALPSLRRCAGRHCLLVMALNTRLLRCRGCTARCSSTSSSTGLGTSCVLLTRTAVEVARSRFATELTGVVSLFRRSRGGLSDKGCSATSRGPKENESGQPPVTSREAEARGEGPAGRPGYARAPRAPAAPGPGARRSAAPGQPRGTLLPALSAAGAANELFLAVPFVCVPSAAWRVWCRTTK